MENEIVLKRELKILAAADDTRTKYVVNVANRFRDKKILLFSLENSKALLQEIYHLEDSKNITVIDMLTTVEQIKAYLKIEKPEYLLIDCLHLLGIEENIQPLSDKIKYELDTLYSYIEDYDVNILVSDYVAPEEMDDKYTNNIYDKCHQVWIVKDDIITRFK